MSTTATGEDLQVLDLATIQVYLEARFDQVEAKINAEIKQINRRMDDLTERVERLQQGQGHQVVAASCPSTSTNYTAAEQEHLNNLVMYLQDELPLAPQLSADTAADDNWMLGFDLEQELANLETELGSIDLNFGGLLSSPLRLSFEGNHSCGPSAATLVSDPPVPSITLETPPPTPSPPLPAPEVITKSSGEGGGPKDSTSSASSSNSVVSTTTSRSCKSIDPAFRKFAFATPYGLRNRSTLSQPSRLHDEAPRPQHLRRMPQSGCKRLPTTFSAPPIKTEIDGDTSVVEVKIEEAEAAMVALTKRPQSPEAVSTAKKRKVANAKLKDVAEVKSKNKTTTKRAVKPAPAASITNERRQSLRSASRDAARQSSRSTKATAAKASTKKKPASVTKSNNKKTKMPADKSKNKTTTAKRTTATLTTNSKSKSKSSTKKKTASS